MSSPFIEQFAVRLYDLDAWNQVRASILMRYIEQTATNLSVSTGFDVDWYAAHGTAFIMRSFRLQRLEPPQYGDCLTVAAWISSAQRVRLHLEFEIRQADQRPVAVGRAEWVHIDRHTRRPLPFDPHLLTLWPGGAPSVLWQNSPALAPSSQEYPPILHQHPVYIYDAEALGVTSFAVYPLWLEESAQQALRAWQYPVDLPNPGPLHCRLDLAELELQYLAPARPGETVTITTRHTGTGEADALVAVEQEIHAAEGTKCLNAKSRYQLTQL